MPDSTEFTDSEDEDDGDSGDDDEPEFCENYDDEPHGHYTTEYVNKFLARLKEALDPTNVKTSDHLLWLLKQNNWWFYDKVGTS